MNRRQLLKGIAGLAIAAPAAVLAVRETFKHPALGAPFDEVYRDDVADAYSEEDVRDLAVKSVVALDPEHDR